MPGLSFVPETDTELATALICAVPVGKGVQMIGRGVQLTYRWDTARRATNEVFQSGGTYAGQVEAFQKQGVRQLRKSIRSFEKIIIEHEQKIRDPKAACKDRDWDNLRLDDKKSLLNRWAGGIQRAANYRAMVKRVLEEKLKKYCCYRRRSQTCTLEKLILEILTIHL